MTPATFTIAPVGTTGTSWQYCDGGPVRRFSTAKIGDEAKFAARVGIDAEWFAECLGAGGGEFPRARPIRPDVFRVRARKAAADTAKTYVTFAEALTCGITGELPADEPIIEWQRTDSVAALDCDLPRSFTPITYERLAGFVGTLQPRPEFAWVTHGGGLRFIFAATSDGQHTADELAAVAFLRVKSTWPELRPEIKHDTRHPGGLRGEQRCSPVIRGGGLHDLSAVRTLLAHTEAAESSVSEWLHGRGMAVGRRYPHEHCCVSPSDKGDNDPVSVLPGGVYCHYCKVFRSYLSLCGDRTASVLGTLARQWVHWGHARYTCEAMLGLTPQLAGLCYRAAMKILHPKDADRIKRVFDSSLHFTRADGYWTTGNGGPLDRGIAEIIRTLPAAVSEARVAELLQSSNIDHLGYHALNPIWGCKIAGIYPDVAQEQATQPTVVRQIDALRSDFTHEFRARYIPRQRADDVARAWEKIETAFPGVNRRLVELLIAAKGCAESGAGLPPMILLYGATGSGKSTHPKLAASICGDSVAECDWSPSSEDRLQNIATAKEHGGFVLFNEVFKSGGDAKRTAVGALNFLLSLSPQLQYRKLYVGRCPLGRLPVLVMTDTVLPEDAAQDPQIARRVVAVELPDRREWVKPMADAGITDFGATTRLASLEFANACNAILSDVTDRFFRHKQTFDVIARSMGFATLEDRSAPEITRRAQEFFRAWLASADVGDGWRELSPSATDPLSNAWAAASDTDRKESRFLASLDWSRHGFKENLELEKRGGGNGSAIRIRFRSRGTGITGSAVANLLESRPADILGHRDPIDGEHSGGRLAELFGTPDDAPDVAGRPVPRADVDMDSAGAPADVAAQSDDTGSGDLPF